MLATYDEAQELLEDILWLFQEEEVAPFNCLEPDFLCECPLLIDALIESLDQKKLRFYPSPSRRVKLLLLAFHVLLTDLRFALDCNQPWASPYWERVLVSLQKAIPHLDGAVVASLLKILTDCHFSVPTNLRELMSAQMVQVEPSYVRASEADKPLAEQIEKFNHVLASLDEYQIWEALQPQFQDLPPEGQDNLLFTLGDANPALREAVVLFWLSAEDQEQRQRIYMILSHFISSDQFTSTMLCRLIMIRNWVDKKSQRQLDSLIDQARKKRIECAVLPSLELVSMKASAFDGAGAQMILFTFRQKIRSRWQYRLCGLLVRLDHGIRDCWVGDYINKAEFQDLYDSFKEEFTSRGGLRDITTDYLALLVPMMLKQMQIQRQHVPIELLQMAEFLGSMQWHQQAYNPEQLLADLIERCGNDWQSPHWLQQSMRRVKRWYFTKGFETTWFEFNDHVEQWHEDYDDSYFVTPEMAGSFITEILEPQRQKWLQILLLCAHWAGDKARTNEKFWKDLTTLAYLVACDEPLDSIPLFIEMAYQSIEHISEYRILAQLRALQAETDGD